jgi:hypothetical protein
MTERGGFDGHGGVYGLHIFYGIAFSDSSSFLYA